MSVHRFAFVLVIALAACDQGERPPPEPVTPGFKDLPAFPRPWSDTMPYDCSITGVFETLFATTQVETCGLIERQADEHDSAAALDCMRRAESSRRPYLLARQFWGIDSEFASAYLVNFEAGARVVYEAAFDSDPCGGSCGDQGRTIVRRCRVAPEAPTLFAATWWNNECKDGEVVGSCRFGKPGVFPRALAEGMSNALLDDSPATLAAAFGPIRIGAPRSIWESADVRRFISMIESGGIVSVGVSRWNSQTDRIAAIRLSLAGPCSRIRALLQQRWGPSTGDSWVNRTLHQRAHLKLETCTLMLERTTDL